MTFYNQLINQTNESRMYLLSAPIIERCFNGDFSIDDYAAFLHQAYHHVKHTTPLLMAVGSRLNEDKEWLREAVAEYIEEELGHQEWILNDIQACGFNKELARKAEPNFETELMVSYAYDSINRVSPLCFFGLVHVLEGTSVAIADNAASKVQNELGLPNNAFSYLRSHGAIDIEHIKFFERLMNKITCGKEQALIISSANKFYRLYGNIFRGLSTQHGLTKAA